MKDEDFLAAFEACALPNEGFHHRDHVRVAWLYLQEYPLPVALNRFCESLKRFALAHGKPDLYHETITWSYVFLIHERIGRNGTSTTWEGFAAENPDLLTWKPSILGRYYKEETLRSELAKKTFLMPDRVEELALR